MFVPSIAEELKHALDTELPPCDGQWASIPAFDSITRLIVHEFARISVLPLMRNKDWLGVQRMYPENVFTVAIQMRIIPGPFQRVSSWLMPSTWRVWYNLRKAKSLVSPIIRERRKLEAASDTSYEKPDDFLQWLMDEAWSERE